MSGPVSFFFLPSVLSPYYTPTCSPHYLPWTGSFCFQHPAVSLQYLPLTQLPLVSLIFPSLLYSNSFTTRRRVFALIFSSPACPCCPFFISCSIFSSTSFLFSLSLFLPLLLAFFPLHLFPSGAFGSLCSPVANLPVLLANLAAGAECVCVCGTFPLPAAVIQHKFLPLHSNTSLASKYAHTHAYTYKNTALMGHHLFFNHSLVHPCDPQRI